MAAVRSVCRSGLSVAVDCLSQWTVCRSGLSVAVDCLSQWTVCRSGLSVAVDCLSQLTVCRSGLSVAVDCLSQWPVTWPPSQDASTIGQDHDKNLPLSSMPFSLSLLQCRLGFFYSLSPLENPGSPLLTVQHSGYINTFFPSLDVASLL